MRVTSCGCRGRQRSSCSLPTGTCSHGPAPMSTTASARRPVNSLTRSPVRSSISTVTRTSIRRPGRRAAASRRWRRRGPWAGGGPGGAGHREHRHPRRRFVPAPFLDADEEHPQRAKPVRDRGRGQPGLVLPGTGGQPRLERLNVPPGDVGQRGRGGCLGEEGGEGEQRLVRVADAARAQHAGDLLQVTAHWDRDLRDGLIQLHPARQQRRAGHRALTARAWASMASAARRYWEASQSSPRCR